MSCADYIKQKDVKELPCEVDVVYRSKIRNVGSKCMNIKWIKKKIDGEEFNINLNHPSNTWSPEKKRFCKGKAISLRKVVRQENLCQFKGQEIDFAVVVRGEDQTTLEDDDSISFPMPKAVTIAPSPALSPAPVISPGCTSKPDSLTFQITRNVCGQSSHSQTFPTRALGRSSKSNKGKGSVKFSCDCETTCIEHTSCDINKISDNPTVIIFAKDSYGGTTELHRGCIPFNTDFVLPIGSNHNCLEIEIRDKDGDYRKVAQVIEFDVTCGPGSPLNAGNKFGAVEIVRFNDANYDNMFQDAR